MNTYNPQRPHTSHLVSRLINSALLLLLTFSLPAAPLVAQTAPEMREAAVLRLFDEGLRLRHKGSKESLRQAIEKFTEAQTLIRDLDDDLAEAGVLLAIGLCYDSLGEKRKVVDYYEQALPFLRAAGVRSGEAKTLNDIGSVYDALGDKQTALNYFKQALPLIQAIGDRDREVWTLNNIGLAYQELGEGEKALEHFTQALSLLHPVEDRARRGAVINNIGVVYSLLSEPQKALDQFNIALSLKHAAGDSDDEAATLNNIGGIYHGLGEEQRALDYYNRALQRYRDAGDRKGEATVLNNIGFTYYDLGEPQKALGLYLTEAQPLANTIGDPNHQATVFNNIGLVYMALGEHQKALDYYNRALLIVRDIGNRNGEARTLNNIGGVYETLGESQKALDHFTESLPLSAAIRDRTMEALTLGNMAHSERKIGKLDDALAHFEAAIAIKESLRTKIGSQELRASFFATAQGYYEDYIDLLMNFHHRQPSAGYDVKALQASERRRARSLLDLLMEAGANIRQGVDPQLVERERALQQQLNASARRKIQLLSGPHTDAQAAASNKEIENLTTELQEIQAQIRQASPRYAALTQPQPSTLEQIQTQVLDTDTLLLEYTLGKDRSYLWVVTPTTLTSYELPRRAEIEAAAREFYLSVRRSPRAVARGATAKREIGGALQQQAQARLEHAAARLSRMLLAPAAALSGKKRLLIVADGALQYIPFAALPEPASEGDGAKPPPLIVQHEIVSLPSASTLAVLRREAGERKATAKTLAVLADPVFERTDERLRVRARQTAASVNTSDAPADESRGLGLLIIKSAQESGVEARGLQIPRLPETRREADAISQLVPPAARLKVLDFAANRAAATAPTLADYRFVHFATHGFLDSQHPELSGIMLSMFDEQGQAQDGFLRAHEIFNLKLNADVVVLSACQTGLGKVVKGEGLVGLTRGFMYAGAPRVMVSLWSVNDAATAELMTRFYKGVLIDKRRPAQALQAAQVSMLNDKRFAAPFYWAAFTLQGEWR